MEHSVINDLMVVPHFELIQVPNEVLLNFTNDENALMTTKDGHTLPTNEQRAIVNIRSLEQCMLSN